MGEAYLRFEFIIKCTSKDDMDKILKHFCGRINSNDDVVMHDTQYLKDQPILSKEDATKDQMRQYINNCIEWLNKEHKCSIPRGE